MLSRLASALFKTTTVNLTVIAVYASTLDAAEETKYSFHDDLQGAVGTATLHTLDKFTVGTRWANFDQLVNFAFRTALWFPPLVSSTHSATLL